MYIEVVTNWESKGIKKKVEEGEGGFGCNCCVNCEILYLGWDYIKFFSWII